MRLEHARMQKSRLSQPRRSGFELAALAKEHTEIDSSLRAAGLELDGSRVEPRSGIQFSACAPRISVGYVYGNGMGIGSCRPRQDGGRLARAVLHERDATQLVQGLRVVGPRGDYVLEHGAGRRPDRSRR
jgi:hypothetical protein